VAPVVTVDDVRSFVSQLPRSYEVLVRDRVKFRVGQIDVEEMRELVFDAWRWVVPKKLAAAYDERFFAGEI
jgi:hypothetical protein